MKLLFASILISSAVFAQVVPFTAETTSIPSTQVGDPTFLSLPRPDGGAFSLLVGTDTAQTGVFTYNVGGVLQQVVQLGLVNGADSRADLVLVTRANGSLDAFSASESGLTALSPSSLSVPTPNHVALRALEDAGFEVWVDTSSRTVKRFTLERHGAALQYAPLADLTVPQTPSGLAVDERTGRVYVALPSVGLLVIERDDSLNYVASIDAGQLGAVIGGLELFPAADGGTLLFTTSPSNDRLVVHSVDGLQSTFLGSFQVGPPDGGSSRARAPKHLDVFEHAFPGFPRGALVVQDTQLANYKLVSLVDVDRVVPLPPAFERHPPPVPSPDAGAADAGAATDAGTGSNVVGGGGTGGPRPDSAPSDPTGCGCTQAPFFFLPALLLLVSIRRTRP